MKQDPSDDIALMAAVRQGDMSAFETLHDRYQAKVLNFYYGLSHDRPIALDLCQETFLRLWRVRKRYRATGSFPGYLFGIARLIWLEWRRKEQRQPPPVKVYAGYAPPEQKAARSARPDERARRSELEDGIMAALEELPEEQRMVFVMRTIQGMSLDNIAQAMDCPLNTVRSRKLLAVKKLRHLLADLHADTRQYVQGD